MELLLAGLGRSVPVSIPPHLLILSVQGRVDRLSPGHVQNLLAGPAPLFPLNFFYQGLFNVFAHVVGTALYLFSEIVRKLNGKAHERFTIGV